MKRKMDTKRMPSEDEASTSRAPQADSPTDAPASTSSTDPEEVMLRRQETPVATPRKTNTFRNLMAQFHGCRNLTPRKLALITNAPDPDEEITERTARMIEEESTTDEEQEAERVRPPRRKASKKARPAEESLAGSLSDISAVETGSEYAPSEVEGSMDFSGFEEISDVELQQLVMDEEDSEAGGTSSDDSDISAAPGPSTARVLARGRARGRRARGRGRGGGDGSGDGNRGRGRGRGKKKDVDTMQQGPQELADGWTLDNTAPPPFTFTGTPGMTKNPPRTALEFFQLFVPFKLLAYFMEETNEYANYMRHELKKPSKYNWSGCNVIDIAKYLGIVMWMGIIKLPEIRMYWSRRQTYSLSAFPAAMSRTRFEVLGKYFHTFNRKAIHKDNRDKLVLLRPVIQFIREQCKSLYLPGENLSIDEGILKWKGRLSIKTYNPMKPVKYGIKFYFLCESATGYVLDFMIYRGVTSTLKDIVFTLMEQHLNKGHHLFMDNYYNSVDISEALYGAGTHCSGTLRLGRGAPESLKAIKKGGGLDTGKMAYRKKDNTFVICWQDRRLVTTISNKYNAQTEEYVHKRRDPTTPIADEDRLQRPLVIKEYINYMGGVDLFDQLVNYYSFAKRSNRWTKKTVFYLLQLGLLNAYILYVQFGGNRPGRNRKYTLREFHQVIADALLYFDENEWPDDGTRIPHATSLPPEERQDRLPTPSPVPSPASPVTVPSPSPVPSSVADDPDEDPLAIPAVGEPTPAAPRPRERDPLAGPPDTARTHTDSGDRLNTSLNHEEELIPCPPGHRLQKRCRVCYSLGKRSDTRYRCKHCKVPLCINKQACFNRYHTVARYWVRTPQTAAPGARPPQ